MTDTQVTGDEGPTVVTEHERISPEVAQAATRLSRRSVVRAAVATLAVTDSDDAVAVLITALDPTVRRWRAERMVAAKALPSLCHTAERRAAAIAALTVAARQERLLGSRLTTGRLGRAFTFIGVAVPATALSCAVTSLALRAAGLDYDLFLGLAGPSALGTVAIGVFSGAISLSKESAARVVVASVEALAELRAAEALDAIVEQLAFPTTTPVQPAAARAIATIAASVTPEHYGLVPKSALAALCRRNKQLQDERIVRMLCLVGGLEVLPTIERLASSRRRSPVRDVAQAYLGVVRDRAARERDAAMLLRPAEAASDASLLRPVTGGPAEAGLLVSPATDPDSVSR